MGYVHMHVQRFAIISGGACDNSRAHDVNMSSSCRLWLQEERGAQAQLDGVTGRHARALDCIHVALDSVVHQL